MVQRLAAALCILFLLLKLWVGISESSTLLSIFVIGILIFNMLPLGFVAYRFHKMEPTSSWKYPLIVGTAIAMLFSINGLGCFAQWWCQPDAQLAIIYVALPIYEAVVIGVVSGVGFGIVKVIESALKPKQ